MHRMDRACSVQKAQAEPAELSAIMFIPLHAYKMHVNGERI